MAAPPIVAAVVAAAVVAATVVVTAAVVAGAVVVAVVVAAVVVATAVVAEAVVAGAVVAALVVVAGAVVAVGSPQALSTSVRAVIRLTSQTQRDSLVFNSLSFLLSSRRETLLYLLQNTGSITRQLRRKGRIQTNKKPSPSASTYKATARGGFSQLSALLLRARPLLTFQNPLRPFPRSLTQR